MLIKLLWGLTGLISGTDVCMSNIDNRRWSLDAMQPLPPDVTIEQAKTLINICIVIKTIVYAGLGPIGVYRKYLGSRNAQRTSRCGYMRPIVMPMYFAHHNLDHRCVMWPLGDVSWLPRL